MDYPTPKRLWLPYAVGIFGMLLSVFIAYLFWLDVIDNNYLLNQLDNRLPWLALVFGSAISYLLAALTHATQVAKYRALTLDQINADLKREIHERLNAEESKQKLELALHQGQKLQAIGTLAGGIAHDFNNLLYAIIGYVEMARDDVEKDTKVFQNLGKVLEAAHRGQEVVSRILAFSRRQHHDHSVIDLKTTIEAALSLLKPAIPSSISISFASSKNCVIAGNQTQIHQILVNMINNAVDAMDGEGNIQIRLNHVETNDPALKLFPGIALDKKYCKIEIKDSGHGIEPHTLARIFEPFYTTKEVGKGTGLGLSIVHTIVKEHNGEIVAVSELGHGTTFVILLPEEAAK